MSRPLATDDIPVKPGQYLAGGKYVVDAVLGVGGMGVVVAATHVHLKHKVAIKFMLPKALSDEEAVQRFVLEGQSAASLKSEHVARVLDVGTLETGAPFIVMEYLQGITLDKYLEQGHSLSIAQAVEYTVQASEAVAEAHARAIAHRDIKLSNLFLTMAADKRPLVKVIDFGLSKVLDTDSKKITRDFSLMGTPAYMSPEQLKATGNVDARTDLWSLGVCLYELLTNHVPFEADSVAEVCAKVLEKPPVPARTYRPDVPEALEAVIARCLEKDPAQRFATVAQLAAALDPFLPSDATGAGERIHRVQSESIVPPSFMAPPLGEPPSIGRGTASSWGADGLVGLEGFAQSRQSNRGWFLLVGIAAFVGIGAIVFALTRRAQLNAANAAEPPPEMTTSAPASVAGPATSSEPAPTAPALASAETNNGPTATAPVMSSGKPAKGGPRVARPSPAPGTPKPLGSSNRDKILENR